MKKKNIIDYDEVVDELYEVDYEYSDNDSNIYSFFQKPKFFYSKTIVATIIFIRFLIIKYFHFKGVL